MHISQSLYWPVPIICSTLLTRRRIEVFNPWGSILTYNSDEVAEDVEETFVLKDDTSLGRGIDGDEDSPE